MESKPQVVSLGTHVQVELIGKRGAAEKLALDLVPDREADFAAGRLSDKTPLARAILGRTPGETVPYSAGDLVAVRILAVTAAGHAPSEETAAAREAKMRQALDRADLNNAISFALTFDSKWGDYDPEAIAANWETPPQPDAKPDDPSAPSKEPPPS